MRGPQATTDLGGLKCQVLGTTERNVSPHNKKPKQDLIRRSKPKSVGEPRHDHQWTVRNLKAACSLL